LEENPESVCPVVLIVDDEVGILNAMRRSLRREGYEILTAEGPRQALELIDAHHVDLVLCDQMMPEMGGVQLLEEIGQRNPKAARLLITGWPDDVGADELAERGITGPLAKPWEDAELKETLRKALAQVQRR
jgi:DNA-binding NtrC family response regulator